jgi:hypothetical protein
MDKNRIPILSIPERLATFRFNRLGDIDLSQALQRPVRKFAGGGLGIISKRMGAPVSQRAIEDVGQSKNPDSEAVRRRT